MPSKRDVLALLSRNELLAVVDRFELAPPDRRAKDGLVETVASSKRATLAELLPELARERLKDISRALGFAREFRRAPWAHGYKGVPRGRFLPLTGSKNSWPCAARRRPPKPSIVW